MSAAPEAAPEAAPDAVPEAGIPDSGAVRLGVVLLCHNDLGRAAQAARIWATGGAAVVVHVDAKVPARPVEAMRQALADLPEVRFSPRHRCHWGDFSLVRATQEAATLLLDNFPQVSHVYLASGSCLPLRPIGELTAWLARDPDCDHIESVNALDAGWTVGGLDVERFTRFFPFDWLRQRRLFDWSVRMQRRLRIARRVPRGIAPHLGSQWWCLTARTLRAILEDPRRAEFDRYFRGSWIPDESYFQTLVRRHAQTIESRSPTLAKFDARGRPHVLYDDHRTLLRESRCFVARKIWPEAEGLYAAFPAASPDPAAEPDPAGFERLMNRAAARARVGRPGLYMQSRFPRKDAENGKTAAPYAVLQGFADLFPDFEPWLQARIAADVHGHLLGPDEVEFAGRGEIGPGALSANTVLRDHDPQGFLAALIRISPRMQAFQYGPRDNQALNWFMVTDPNARLFVITGAWLAPLLSSDMPFDDVRRIAALLQRAERRQLDILQSVWVKAPVRLWDLAECVADPRAVLAQVVAETDPEAGPIGELPAMRPLDGMAPFLRRLRNAGLHSHLTGDFPASSPAAAAGSQGKTAHG